MQKEQKFKSSIQLANREETGKLVQPVNSPKNKISFDLYFQKLVKLGKASPHHKAPMRQYAESKGLKDAEEAEFDKVFSGY